jgi:hypothetical protein
VVHAIRVVRPTEIVALVRINASPVKAAAAVESAARLLENGIAVRHSRNVVSDVQSALVQQSGVVTASSFWLNLASVRRKIHCIPAFAECLTSGRRCDNRSRPCRTWSGFGSIDGC